MFSMAKINKKLASVTGSVSGAASILGSWQICHNICLGLIALLSAVGITLTGMPLLFFTKIAIPLWIIAVVMLGVVAYLYFKKGCISKNLLFFNTGLIIAGTPFASLQKFQIFFWVIGGIIASIGIILYVKEKFSKKECDRCKHE